jgi:hypothetical protein
MTGSALNAFKTIRSDHLRYEVCSIFRWLVEPKSFDGLCRIVLQSCSDVLL